MNPSDWSSDVCSSDLNVSVDYLLGRTDNPNSDNLEEDEIATFFRVNTEDLKIGRASCRERV